MIYILAALLPPLGLLLNGQPFSADLQPGPDRVLRDFRADFPGPAAGAVGARADRGPHEARGPPASGGGGGDPPARPAAGLSALTRGNRAIRARDGLRLRHKSLCMAGKRFDFGGPPCYRPPPTLPMGFDSTVTPRRRRRSCSSHRSIAANEPPKELAMAVVQGLQGIREAYTFDDVLLKPGLSDILPSEADIRSHVTRAIPLNIPDHRLRDGHRHRSAHGDRHGAGRRHRRDPPQFRRRRPGRPGAAGQEVSNPAWWSIR